MGVGQVRGSVCGLVLYNVCLCCSNPFPQVQPRVNKKPCDQHMGAQRVAQYLVSSPPCFERITARAVAATSVMVRSAFVEHCADGWTQWQMALREIWHSLGLILSHCRCWPLVHAS